VLATIDFNGCLLVISGFTLRAWGTGRPLEGGIKAAKLSIDRSPQQAKVKGHDGEVAIAIVACND